MLSGIDVMDGLVREHKNLRDLRMFKMVNLEAIRKILKKYHKKTSGMATVEVNAVLEHILDGTPLEDAHETDKLITTELAMLFDAQAQISLKSSGVIR